MSDKKNSNGKETININLLFSTAGTRLLSVFSINIVTIGIFGLIGYFLDAQFDTKPLFLLILLAISFPLSLYLITKRARQITEKLSKK